MKKLAIITTHPIQYHAPFFKLLTTRGKIHPKVFYTWEQAQSAKYDPGFCKVVSWDIPLLEGYDHTFVTNISPKPGADHFWGVMNPSLNSEITEWQADAILVFGWCYYSHLSAMLHFKNRIPICFRGDSTLLDEAARLKQRLRQVYLSWVYRHVDIAFYVGQSNKQYFLAGGLRNNQLKFAPHAIDNARFHENADEAEKKALVWRRSLGIKDQDVVFLFSGKFEEKKAPELLLKAFLKMNQPNTHLIYAGTGALETILKKESKGNVHFIGFQNQTDMPIVYRLGDIFVLPSKGPDETWGLAVNEAMACGLPVLVSNRCGCAVDLARDGINGFVYRSEDLEGLVSKMHSLAHRTDLKVLGEASRNIIQHYSFKKLCQTIEASIENVSLSRVKNV